MLHLTVAVGVEFGWSADADRPDPATLQAMPSIRNVGVLTPVTWWADDKRVARSHPDARPYATWVVELAADLTADHPADVVLGAMAALWPDLDIADWWAA